MFLILDERKKFKNNQEIFFFFLFNKSVQWNFLEKRIKTEQQKVKKRRRKKNNCGKRFFVEQMEMMKGAGKRRNQMHDSISNNQCLFLILIFQLNNGHLYFWSVSFCFFPFLFFFSASNRWKLKNFQITVKQMNTFQVSNFSYFLQKPSDKLPTTKRKKTWHKWHATKEKVVCVWSEGQQAQSKCVLPVKSYTLR